MSRPWQYVVIEGVIGVGKTTLASRLAEALGGEIVLEEFEENPFLPGFYEDRSAYALSTQLFFLMSRFQQQRWVQPNLFRPFTVSDYLFDKDQIFASLNLDEAELALYEQLFEVLRPQVAAPDVVIYLQADIDTILERIKRRGRVYERGMDPDYLRSLHYAYSRFFARYSAAPVVALDTVGLDLRSEENTIQLLVDGILKGQLPSWVGPASDKSLFKISP